MTSAELTALRRVYGEVCRGYSETTWRGNPVYVAHLTTFDQTDIDAAQQVAYTEAVARGVKTEKERLKWLDANKVWTGRDEIDLAKQRGYVENLEKTASKGLTALRQSLAPQIREERDKLDQLAARRYRGIGVTAERVAEQKVQYEYIRAAFYRDIGLEERLFTREHIRALSDEDSDDLLIAYVDVATRLSEESIRRIAVQPFFLNPFSLCGKAVDRFFGVPVVDLTLKQADLLLWGRYYQSVFEHHKIPKELREDPTKIDEFMAHSAAAKDVLAKAGAGQGGRVGIVGGTKEDFDAMGVRDDTAMMQATTAKGYADGKAAAKDLGYEVKTK